MSFLSDPRWFPRFPLQRDAEFHWAQRQRGALLGGRPLLRLRDHRQLRVRRAVVDMAVDMAWIYGMGSWAWGLLGLRYVKMVSW